MEKRRKIRILVADDHFVVRIEAKTGHKVTPESQREAIEWFARWLKP